MRKETEKQHGNAEDHLTQNEDMIQWDLAREKAKEEYEEEYGEGSWEERADKYEREDYVWAAYEKLKGENQYE